MIIIKKDLIKKINEFEELRKYLSVAVDLNQEKRFSDLHNELFADIKSLNKDFTNNDIAHIITILIDEDAEEKFYLYGSDEIIEVLFPGIGKKNNIIQSAYYWIEERSRIEWIINNVLCDNKYYNIIDNVNDRYILSREKLNNII